MENLKESWLQLTTSGNVNRTIYMVQQDAETFSEFISRTGSTSVQKKYPMKFWKTVYDKHIAQGMVDISELHNKQNAKGENHLSGINQNIRDLLKRLQMFARDSFMHKLDFNRNCSSEKTSGMIHHGKLILDKLMQENDVSKFNQLLIELFTVCPMEMDDVSAFLANSKDDFSTIIAFHSDRLDSLEIELKASASHNGTEWLEKMGFSIRPMTELESAKAKEKMTDAGNHFIQGFRVNNKQTDQKYMDWKKEHLNAKEFFYFHGSGNENILSIMSKGLTVNSKKLGAIQTGKMFGNGLYFATRALKSIGYTSVRWKHAPGVSSSRDSNGSSYLFVFKVAYENPLHINSYESWMHHADQYLKKHDAVFAHKRPGFLCNHEIVVYNPDQTTLYAVLEIK